MIAYHIDRTNSLQPGQEITLIDNYSFMSCNLFEGKVSRHGDKYLSNCANDAPFSAFLIEHEFELVRQKFFPESPSRLQSFFALKFIDDIILWPGLLTQPYKIYEIEFSHKNCDYYDASFLNSGLYPGSNIYWSPQLIFESAFQYWSRKSSKSPQPELLIIPPVTIREEKHLSIGLI